MEKFNKLTGVAAPLSLINVDTDMIIPKQFLKTIERTGLGKHLFSEMRYDENGNERPDFVLNQPAYRARLRYWWRGTILAADRHVNMHHGPYLDFGIRCVVAESFADIFYNNCFKNGILPIKLPANEVALLMDDAQRGANATITIDLPAQEITGPDGGLIRFEIDPFRKHCLILRGWTILD